MQAGAGEGVFRLPDSRLGSPPSGAAPPIVLECPELGSGRVIPSLAVPIPAPLHLRLRVQPRARAAFPRAPEPAAAASRAPPSSFTGNASSYAGSILSSPFSAMATESGHLRPRDLSRAAPPELRRRRVPLSLVVGRRLFNLEIVLELILVRVPLLGHATSVSARLSSALSWATAARAALARCAA